MTDRFFGIMETHLYGQEPKKFLEECHKHFMRDVGKRNLVISRLH